MKPVYTLDDLQSREILDAGFSKPARLAVIGYPVAHSASPEMHQPALDAHGIDARYIRLELTPDQVKAGLSKMRALGFIGCNVTVPHKFAAIECCDEVHPDARAIGAVNTIRFDADATRGYNTDGPGFQRAVEERFNIALSSLTVAIAGAAGGAGQAIATQCVMNGVKKLVLINRNQDKLQQLVQRLKALPQQPEIIALDFTSADLTTQCLACQLIVNTSSIGLKKGDPSILPASCLHPDQRVYDTIYQPPVTPLLAAANHIGCQTENGLSMLIHQGALAFNHWFPKIDPLAIMRKALS
jgi:shikimate dehydrogenase